MVLPDYWLTRPSATDDEEARTAFDALLDTTLGGSDCPTIRYTLPWLKWQFLCHVAEHRDIALHGSGDADIALFEPRQSIDLNEFGSRKAVYAAADGIWPMFFAVVDRDRVDTVSNACVRLVDETGEVHGPYYVFSVSQSALANRPWRTGWVYLLPRQTFSEQPSFAFGSSEVHVPQLAGEVSIRPLAKLMIEPEDFPFLMQIRGHDDQRLQEYATAMQTAAPWPDDL